MDTHTDLATAVLQEVRCTPANRNLHIAALVEDHGPQVVAVIRQLHRERRVRMVATGNLGMSAAEYGMEVSAYRALCIEGEMEVYTAVEARE